MKPIWASLISLLTIAWTCCAVANQAEVVWVESGVERNYIYYSYFTDGQWVEVENPIYITKNAVFTPFLFNQANGNRTLLWTESNDSIESKIMAMSAPAIEGAGEPSWSMPRLWYGEGVSNLAVTAISDLAGDSWYFWTHYDGDDSQIYTVTPRSNVATPVHADNDVPDYDAFPALQDDGRVSVSWYSFNTSMGDYERVETIMTEASEVQKFDLSKLKDVTKISEIPLPGFLPNGQLIRIFFAGNRKTPFIEVPR